ncbi:hypothetical protein R1flu_005302 [Riccia fluitans]|uniref:Choline transporter-like protein n=1 Tax=Riccia fluitans TaxID=41844 RepID=A0ABD1YT14_9MARC
MTSPMQRVRYGITGASPVGKLPARGRCCTTAQCGQSVACRETSWQAAGGKEERGLLFLLCAISKVVHCGRSCSCSPHVVPPVNVVPAGCSLIVRTLNKIRAVELEFKNSEVEVPTFRWIFQSGFPKNSRPLSGYTVSFSRDVAEDWRNDVIRGSDGSGLPRSLSGSGPSHHAASSSHEVEEDFASVNSAGQDGESSAGEGSCTPPPLGRTPEPTRKWRDVFWLIVFVLHAALVGFLLAILGINRYRRNNRFAKLAKFSTSDGQQTQEFWPILGTAAAIGAALGLAMLSVMCLRPNQLIKVAVHSVTTYLAVISVFCFWDEQFFWGIAFAIGAALQFLYVISVMDRLPFSILVIKMAVRMLLSLPATIRVSYGFVVAMIVWMLLWSFGVSGVVASGMDDNARWWILLALSISLFWTGAVFCNTVHVIVSGVIYIVLSCGAQSQVALPSRPVLRSLRHAVTTSIGSICYGSLLTAAIRVFRWSIRGLRSRIGNNECLLCCVDFLFNIVEILVRFFNKYAFVQVAVYGKGFNHSARDAWELFQSTGVEALIAYDLTGAVLLMVTVLGGLITGTSVGVWAWYKNQDRVIMVGSTAMLMGMVLVYLCMVVIEGAVTSIYACYAEDPSLISKWDTEFADEIAETLHQRFQHRSGRDVPAHMVSVQLPKPLPEVL